MIEAGGLRGQSEPDEALVQAVEMARESWLGHNVSDLVAGSDTVRLRIPNVAPSASLRPGQAKSLLEQYLKPAEELSFDLRDIKNVAADHAYAEVNRVYVVEGATEQKSATVFLGFRLVDGRWRLREVRVAP
jgi:hypothetical protein